MQSTSTSATPTSSSDNREDNCRIANFEDFTIDNSEAPGLRASTVHFIRQFARSCQSLSCMPTAISTMVIN